MSRKEYVSEMIYLIAENEPFTVSKYKIAELINIKEETIDYLINNLELITAPKSEFIIYYPDKEFLIKYNVKLYHMNSVQFC